MASAERGDKRLTWQENMELKELPLSSAAQRRGATARRFISCSPAYLPGSDIDGINDMCGPGKAFPRGPIAAFGGHVFCQAALAADRAANESKAGLEADGERRVFGLHTVHGYFSEFGLTDRPFIYDVTAMSTGRSFVTFSVTARQTVDRASCFSDGGEHGSTRPFTILDPAGYRDSDLGPVCFSAMVSFKLPEPHSAGLSLQEPPARLRLRELLGSRPPEAWPPAPRLDMQGIIDGAGPTGAQVVGIFPALDMRKVDTRAYNARRPLHEKRELLFYRILAPMPIAGARAADVNAHALLHAYQADRSGLLMAANLVGLGRRGVKLVTTLSNSFVVHTNADDAVMRHESEAEDGKKEWWLHEICYPRFANGRMILEGKVWSPAGVHVATTYQDGLVRAERGFSIDAADREKL